MLIEFTKMYNEDVKKIQNVNFILILSQINYCSLECTEMLSWEHRKQEFVFILILKSATNKLETKSKCNSIN